MQFRVLGPVEVAVEGRRTAVASERQRTILAVLLAARNSVVSADRLVDALWGTRPPPSARRSLHSHISRLRRVLAQIAPDGADAVTTETDGYRLQSTSHDLDADRFEKLLGQARHRVDADPEHAARLLDEALELWRGLAFGELADHDLVRAEAMRLDELRAVAIATRADARLAVGDHDAAIGELEATVAAHPFDERSHGQLMVALYRSGRQADALAVYRQLRQRLVEEVGVDPSPHVQEINERVLRHDTGLSAPRPSHGVRRAAHPSDRDEQPDPFADAASRGLVGRDQDVAALTKLVTEAPLVTLTGTGGVGKSSLAQEVVGEVGHRFEDGVAWCELAAVSDPASVPTVLIDTLGIQHKGDRPTEESLLAGLGTQQLLLVLDNCEHLLDAVARVVDRIRSRCPHVTVLATSREYLHLSGERIWEVDPLDVPPADAGTAAVAATPAGILLCTRAQAVEPTFTLTDANAATIAQLCRRLDGIPLAIELAASRMRALAPEALAERIDQRFELLAAGSHRTARHRTLQAVVDWSYGLLTDAEACLFDRLSVFAGTFPLTAAEQVGAGDPLATRHIAGLVAELVDKSLVSVVRSEGRVRYRMLDTLRAYGAERLGDRGGSGTTRHAHASFHVRLVEELAPQVRGPDERAAVVDLDTAHDDLRIAHAWLVGSGDVDGALRVPAALLDDLHFRPRDEVFTWAERALELPDAGGNPAYPAAMTTAARGALNRGDLDHAHNLAETALAGAEPASLTALWAMYVLTTTALYQGRLDDALVLSDRRVTLADSLGEVYHRALAGVSRSLALMYRGDSDDAVRAAAEARRDAELSGNRSAQAWALYSNGEALLDTDPTEAARLFEQAIEAARHVHRRFIEGVALVSLASLCGRSGETSRAVELFRETVAHWRRLGVHAQQLTTLRNLVELLVRVGADEPAAVLHGAVAAGSTPSFGAEAARLAAAWEQLETRLGSGAAAEAAERGRSLTPVQVVDTALTELDALREAP